MLEVIVIGRLPLPEGLGIRGVRGCKTCVGRVRVVRTSEQMDESSSNKKGGALRTSGMEIQSVDLALLVLMRIEDASKAGGVTRCKGGTKAQGLWYGAG